MGAFILLSMIGTYEIINTINGKRYVGSTKDIVKRFNCHRYNLRKNKHHCQPLQNAFNKYGEYAFDFKVIEYCPIDKLEEKENVLLDCDNLYNVAKSAYCLRGANHPMYGKVHSINAKRKIKEARSRQVIKHSSETKAKIGIGNKGKPANREHILKMVAVRNGKAWNKGIKTGIEPINKIKFSVKDKKIIIDKYLSGQSIEGIRKHVGVSWDTIKTLLKSNNIKSRTIKEQKIITDERKSRRNNKPY